MLHFVLTMLSYVLICLTFYGFLSSGAFADDFQGTSLLLKNVTDETQTAIVITLLNNAENLLDDTKKHASVKTRFLVVDTVCDKTMDCPKVVCNKLIDLSYMENPMDCAEVMEKNPSAESGVYKIRPLGMELPIEVYCDMEDDGGGWTVLQRRGDFGNAKDYFYRDWQSYKKGFGVLTKEFWLGNDNIFHLTNQRSYIIKFTLTDWENNSTYAIYNEFRIDNEDKKYKLYIREYNQSYDNIFDSSDGRLFTTKDQDNDDYYDTNWAVNHKGGWWYRTWEDTNLNGIYMKGESISLDVLSRYTYNGRYSLKDTLIKIRPKDF